MRITMLTATRVPNVPSPLLLDVAERLRRRGHRVDAVTPEKVLVDLDRLAATSDVYLLKSHTDHALSLAAQLDDLGARIINPLRSCTLLQDKVRAHRRLADAGVPVPWTAVTGSWAAVADLLAVRSPLLVKPVRGHRGAGVEVLRTPGQLRGRPDPAGPLLVQDYVVGPGEDLKVYVVGDQVWAVRKPFSPDSFTRPGRPVPVTAEVAELAVRVGTVFGLSLYGIDVIESGQGPVVVDVNYFPGYKGCVGVASPMADLVHELATSTSAPLPAAPAWSVLDGRAAGEPTTVHA